MVHTEISIALGITAFLLLIAVGGPVWFWVGLFALAFALGYRAYKSRCPNCGERPVTGRKMRFCNQCGAKQSLRRAFQFRCESCRKLARSEIALNFCNRCGSGQ
jgi:rRNA maturation endonuclease Nob1